MPRHAKNNTAAPTLTSGEKIKLDAKWGLKKVRLGGDSLKDFDACTLCLHQAADPMTCPKGHLFCKACIYECLLTQKQYIKAQQKLYDEQEKEKQSEALQKEQTQKQKEIEKFEKLEMGIKMKDAPVLGKTKASEKAKSKEIDMKAPATGWQAHSTPEGGEVFLLDKDLIRKNLAIKNYELKEEDKELRKKVVPCFWIPNLTPDVGAAKVAPPPKCTICPAGGHVLRLKNLRPVRLTQVSEELRTKLSKKKEFMSNNAKYMCPGCQRTLTNTTLINVLSKCGHVHCSKCIDVLVKKDSTCLSCGEHFRGSKHIIPLQNGGTGFAAHGASLATAKITPNFQA